MELSRGHLRINSFWRQLVSPLGFAILVDSLLWIPLSFSLLGFTMIFCSWGTTYFPVGVLLYFYFLGEIHQSPKENIAYFPLDPVSDYVYIPD